MDDAASDTRGIVDPDAMLQHVEYDRMDAGGALDGVVEWFWTVAWDLPPGTHRDQEVLNHPAANISIGTIDDDGSTLDPAEGRAYGVHTKTSSRHLVGRGWTVAARSSVGGVGVLLGIPARSSTDGRRDLAEVLDDAGRVVADIASMASNQERIDRLRASLEARVRTADPTLLSAAREVAAIASQAERDRTICRVRQLAESAGMSVRTLQRLFDDHVGVSPTFVIRRWRIIEAVETAGGRSDWPGWAELAAELGYADQAHLSRDFRQHLNVTPSAYRNRNR